jgi:hypothetical protein
MMLSVTFARRITMAVTPLVVMALVPIPAHAQFGFRIPGGIGNIIIGPQGGNPYSSGAERRKRRGGESSEETSTDKGKDTRAATVTLSRGETDVVFKGIVVSKGLGAVGVEEPIDTSKHDLVREGQRDYTGAIKNLLGMIDNAAKSNSRQGDSSLSQGDVTQHSIDRSVSRAYEAAGLSGFEQFLGEQWTNERLRVAILDRASAEVPGLLVGNNFSRVDMEPVDDIIARASRSIYKRTLETSELISVNQATARYTRALFELHGPAANSDLRAGVEDMLLTASKTVFADYEERFVRSEYGVMMRYRAERILVDCLSANIEEITTVNGHATTKDEMINKVTELSRGECRNWVVNAIGDPKQSDPKTDEQVLKPLPERAVWVAPGVPKTDASMFGRATSNP